MKSLRAGALYIGAAMLATAPFAMAVINWDFVAEYVIDDATETVDFSLSGVYSYVIVCDKWDVESSSLDSVPFDDRRLMSVSAAYITGHFRVVNQSDGQRETTIYKCGDFSLDAGPSLTPTSGWERVVHKSPGWSSDCFLHPDLPVGKGLAPFKITADDWVPAYGPLYNGCMGIGYMGTIASDSGGPPCERDCTPFTGTIWGHFWGGAEIDWGIGRACTGAIVAGYCWPGVSPLLDPEARWDACEETYCDFNTYRRSQGVVWSGLQIPLSVGDWAVSHAT